MIRRLALAGAVALVAVAAGSTVARLEAQRPFSQPDRAPGGLAPNLMVGILRGPQQESGPLQIMLLNDFTTRTVEVTPATRFIKQENARAADLKLGDHVTVQGTPTALAVSHVRTGAEDLNRQLLPQPPPMPATPPGPPGMAPLPPTKPVRAETMTVAGKISSLKPLKMRTEDGVTIQLALDPDVIVTRSAIGTRKDATPETEALVQLDPAQERPTALVVQIGKLPLSTREALYHYQLLRSKLRNAGQVP